MLVQFYCNSFLIFWKQSRVKCHRRKIAVQLLLGRIMDEWASKNSNVYAKELVELYIVGKGLGTSVLPLKQPLENLLCTMRFPDKILYPWCLVNPTESRSARHRLYNTSITAFPNNRMTTYLLAIGGGISSFHCCNILVVWVFSFTHKTHHGLIFL